MFTELMASGSGGGASGRCIYIGSASSSQSFDIASKYSSYASLTTDNFLVAYKLDGLYTQVGSGSITSVYVYNPSVSYDASTGTLNVTGPKVYYNSSKNTYLKYEVYLVTDIET